MLNLTNTWSRRNVLRAGGLAAVLGAGAATAACRRSTPKARPTLVLIELRGGNDGLNTIVPVRDPRYKRLRPQVALSSADMVDFEPDLVVHRAMEPLVSAWRSGRLAIMRGVGVPDGNRSHFHARDQWACGALRPQGLPGWLARVGDQRGRAATVCVDDAPIGAALGGDRPPVIMNSFADILASDDLMSHRALADIQAVLGKSEADRTLDLAIDVAVRTRSERVMAPEAGDGTLGSRLDIVADLIEARHPTLQYALKLDGFDTHAKQAYGHSLLLAELAQGLARFDSRMQQMDSSHDVVVLVVSEFGRRVQENGSLGTDHGLAGPAFALGGSVRGGLFGKAPDLDRLDAGDLPVGIDFRRLLAEVVRFVDVDPASILDSGVAVEPVGFL